MKTKNNYKLVSVIIPVFNTDPFLMRKCITSLLSQTHKNIEIIIINDGTTREETIHELKKLKDNQRIRIINNKNSGVSHTRNIGLRYSKGEYITFVDSDDYLNDTFISEMVKTAQKTKADVVFSKIVRVEKNNKTMECKICCETGTLAKNIDAFLKDDWLFTSQGTLFRSSIAKQKLFDEKQAYAEDTDYTIRVLGRSTFALSNNSKYFYVQSSTSALHKTNRESIRKYIEGCFQMLNTVASIYPEHKDAILTLKKDKIFRACRKLVNGKTSYSEFKAFIHEYRSKKPTPTNTKYYSIKNVAKSLILIEPFTLLYFCAFKARNKK